MIRGENLYNPTWQERSNCLNEDPEIFFSKNKKKIEKAKAICLACPVRAECLQWTLQIESKEGGAPHGIFAGEIQSKRAKMRICLNKDCNKTRLPKINYFFCSDECKQEHEKTVRNNYKSRRLRNNSDYYMRGRINDSTYSTVV